jgi:PAS domain S-box-containing protein
MLFLFEGEHGPRDTLRFIEEKADLGTWTWDLTSRKMEWSPGLFRLLGLEPGSIEPSYRLFQTMVHPNDLRPPGEIERILSEGGTIEREFRILKGDGRVRYIFNRGEILFDRAGKPVKAIGVVLDVTRLHESQSAVEAGQDRFSGLVEAMSAIVWTVNADGMVGDIPQWRRFTGQSLPQVSGYGWLDVIHPDDRVAVRDAWNSAVANRVSYEFEYRLRRIDGVYRWVRARAVPVFRKDGSVREWVGLCVDIHHQKVWAPIEPASPITGPQLRAARGILNWSVRDLANAAKISASTIRRLEEANGALTEPEDALVPLKETLEGAGVEFLFPPLGKPGVRPR